MYVLYAGIGTGGKGPTKLGFLAPASGLLHQALKATTALERSQPSFFCAFL